MCVFMAFIVRWMPFSFVSPGVFFLSREPRKDKIGNIRMLQSKIVNYNAFPPSRLYNAVEKWCIMCYTMVKHIKGVFGE